MNQTVHPRNPPLCPRTCPLFDRDTWCACIVTLVAMFWKDIVKLSCLLLSMKTPLFMLRKLLYLLSYTFSDHRFCHIYLLGVKFYFLTWCCTTINVHFTVKNNAQVHLVCTWLKKRLSTCKVSSFHWLLELYIQSSNWYWLKYRTSKA